MSIWVFCTGEGSLISFFLESMLLGKVISVQKPVLANVHPVFFFPVRYLTAKAIDDFVRVPMKATSAKQYYVQKK